MSTADTIRRNGAPIIWRKMAGDGGVYDYSTASVVAPPAPAPTTIYGVIDGFGSVESQLRGEEFPKEGGLDLAGAFRVFTTTRVEVGDTLEFDGSINTVFFVKSVWKRGTIVLYQALVRR